MLKINILICLGALCTTPTIQLHKEVQGPIFEVEDDESGKVIHYASFYRSNGGDKKGRPYCT